MWKKLLALLVVILLAAGAGAYFWLVRAIDAPGPAVAETRIIVKPGSGLLQIAWQLKRAGVIDHPRLFQFVAERRDLAQKLQAGEYLFPAAVSLGDALEKIASGDTETHFVTFAEGLTSHAMLAVLGQAEGLTGDLPDEVAEGSLLPSTYDYSWGDSRADVLARMQAAMTKAVGEAWAARADDLPIQSPEELVTLASIVEKETGLSGERAEVAGVFVNRLRRGMKLQSDPTTIYAITRGKSILGRGLRRSELANKDPYNTYYAPALPPGPIANPGEDALTAVAQPAATKALYFVADGSGGHAFATTLAEHNRNVAKWRKIERERKASN